VCGLCAGSVSHPNCLRCRQPIRSVSDTSIRGIIGNSKINALLLEAEIEPEQPCLVRRHLHVTADGVILLLLHGTDRRDPARFFPECDERDELIVSVPMPHAGNREMPIMTDDVLLLLVDLPNQRVTRVRDAMPLIAAVLAELLEVETIKESLDDDADPEAEGDDEDDTPEAAGERVTSWLASRVWFVRDMQR